MPASFSSTRPPRTRRSPTAPASAATSGRSATIPTDENRALIVAKYAAEQRGFTKFAVLSVDSDYGRSAIEFTKKYLPQFKGRDPHRGLLQGGRGRLPQRSGEDPRFRRAGDHHVRPRRHDADHRAPDDRSRACRQGAADRQRRVQYPDRTSRPRRRAMEGAVEAAAWLPAWDSPKSKAFVDEVHRRLSSEGPNNHAYVHWETVHLLAQAIKEAGSADREKVREALSKIKYDSAVGEVTFDDHNQATPADDPASDRGRQAEHQGRLHGRNPVSCQVDTHETGMRPTCSRRSSSRSSTGSSPARSTPSSRSA